MRVLDAERVRLVHELSKAKEHAEADRTREFARAQEQEEARRRERGKVAGIWGQRCLRMRAWQGKGWVMRVWRAVAVLVRRRKLVYLSLSVSLSLSLSLHTHTHTHTHTEHI